MTDTASVYTALQLVSHLVRLCHPQTHLILVGSRGSELATVAVMVAVYGHAVKVVQILRRLVEGGRNVASCLSDR